jgi:hypothetical protein
MPALPNFSHKIPKVKKKRTFSGKMLCVDSEYMLEVANGPILVEKSLINTFFGNIPKKWKSHT